MTMSEETASRPYSWLSILIIVMTVLTLAISGIAFRYIETRMVATVGETLALTVAEVSDKLDRVLFERYSDVQIIARAFSTQPDNREFQSAYVAWTTAPITGPGGEFLGVETEEQTVLLSKQKCYRAQRFAFCKPVPAEELTARLDTWPGTEAVHILSRRSGVATAAPGQNGKGPGRAQLDLGAARCAALS
jgi:hypothetical protein